MTDILEKSKISKSDVSELRQSNKSRYDSDFSYSVKPKPSEAYVISLEHI